jgi:hypothetical protein
VIAAFAGVTCWMVVLPLILVPQSAGLDARLYTYAAQVWLAGGDPYVTPLGPHYVVAPPPSLLPFVPFVWLPLDVVSILMVAIDLAVAVAMLRRLHLPMWWLAYPPLAAAIYVGSSEPLLLATLVFAPGFLAPIIKVYGVLPLLAERRWRDLLIAGVILVVTFPILPWDHFIADRQQVATALAEQTDAGVIASPVLAIIAVVALLSLGLRRALWLAAPVLSPGTRPHYAVVSIPKTTMLLAFFWAFPVPLLTVLGLVALVISERLAPSARPEPGVVTETAPT